jgi:rhodanese-related sulfurtransferase
MSRRLKKRKTVVQHTNINRSWIVLIVIAALVVAAVLFIKIRSGAYTLGLHPTRTPVAMTATPMNKALPSEVSPAQASQMQASGALILDVREQDEWDAGHVEGATLIPLGELANRLSELPQDTQIIVMCKSGNRSAKGRDLLLANGFTQVTSLAGGITAWIEAGLPTVTGK